MNFRKLKTSTTSQTHFGFTKIGSKVHRFSSTAIYFWQFSIGASCILHFDQTSDEPKCLWKTINIFKIVDKQQKDVVYKFLRIEKLYHLSIVQCIIFTSHYKCIFSHIHEIHNTFITFLPLSFQISLKFLGDDEWCSYATILKNKKKKIIFWRTKKKVQWQFSFVRNTYLLSNHQKRKKML